MTNAERKLAFQLRLFSSKIREMNSELKTKGETPVSAREVKLMGEIYYLQWRNRQRGAK